MSDSGQIDRRQALRFVGAGPCAMNMEIEWHPDRRCA